MKKYLVALVCVLSGSLSQAATIPDEFINNWLVLGTFPNDAKNTGFNRAWIMETSAGPVEGQAAGGKKWAYFDDRLFSRNFDDYQDLLSYFKIKRRESVEAKVVYAHTYVYVPAATTATLQAGADSEARIWLNGAPIAEVTPQVSTDTLNYESWKRISLKQEVTLNAGWNRILVKVANTEDTRLGFYLGLNNAEGQPIKGLTVSVNGPAGPLAVTTGAMADISKATMPTGWREWPYLGARPDPELIYPPGTESSEQGWLIYNMMRTPKDPAKTPGRHQSGVNLLQSTDFFLQAQGGQAPYAWAQSGGEMPPGLSITSEGRIAGTIAEYAPLKTYTFTARVKDAAGAIAHKELSIDVKERANKKAEQARLLSLIHVPQVLEDAQIDKLVKIMKDQGYQMVIPITYNNGDLAFQYPSKFAPKDQRDIIKAFKDAADKYGIEFGMYMGNLNLEYHQKSLFKDKFQHQVIEEAMERYHPKAFWFDWPTRDGEALDALYSEIKTIDPDITLIVNGHTNGTNGDWDIMDFEAWGAWGHRIWSIFPVNFAWPKKHAPESWRLMTDPLGPANEKYFPNGPFTNERSDWKEYLRVQLALIGEGFIANLDHSATLKWAGETVKDFDKLPLVEDHRSMASWASPAGKPPLYPSFTQVNVAPIEPAPWGYSTINVARDTIYLHILKNARGKTGLAPGDESLTVGPVEGKVKSVTWMNENKPLTFQQRGTATDRTVTVDLKGVTPDEIDTIVKIQLEQPLPLLPPKAKEVVPPGNLAFGKPARLLDNKNSRVLIPSSGNFSYYGNDGKLDTVAVAGGQYAWTYEVDLGRVYPVKKIVINFGVTWATELELFISDDGKDWISLGTATGEQNGKLVRDLDQPTEGRFVRVRALKPDNKGQPGGQMSIAELEVYE